MENNQRIEIIRRVITEHGGRMRLVHLAGCLTNLHGSGFAGGYWCGYRSFRAMLEANPEHFEIFGESNTDKSVRLASNRDCSNSEIATQALDMNFDNFMRNHITPESLAELSTMCDLSDGLEDPCVLYNVIRFTGHKAEAEGKVLLYNNMRMFHTGLFYNNTDEVFLLWGYNNSGQPLKFFMRRSCKEAREAILRFGNRVPELVQFPSMQFDSALRIEPEFGHIFDERTARIPDEIIEMLRHSSGLSEEYQVADKEDIVRASRNFLRRLLIGCIQDTQTRLENRQDEAVQFWFRRDDKMCWLIPLRLGVTEEVNLALVLEPSQLNGVPVYRAHTVLALKEAFKCARLLGPVRAEWLRDVWRENMQSAC